MPPSTPSPDSIEAHKAAMRARIEPSLRAVALPDPRFHYDFGSFIADFADSQLATRRVTSLPAYASARTIFIAPDNPLEKLRAQALRDGKTVLVTTYGIRRGFVMLEPERCRGREEVAAMLDGMEKVGVGRKVTLGAMRREGMRVDMCVTGTQAVSETGVRFGKGHGFFDLEWGMLYSLGLVEGGTPVVAVAHDCQVVGEGEELRPDVFDAVCDFVVTPSRSLVVEGARKPRCGILWEVLPEERVDGIPPLRELREMQELAGVGRSVELRGMGGVLN
ncbi:nagb/rpia/CoA transferase-like protein [Saccharata proteae CBS 121410]|uniref:Nagb/rpia/CoA transferase-like protein n=1 Tax=Saccharata proteae CBS 121410 TaxID=1314787 RepID=A0A9P4HQN9_9PEZI|nr:nagb/rpia/CoA transferase-like protein [Saccharata proteae CBS 121410]